MIWQLFKRLSWGKPDKLIKEGTKFEDIAYKMAQIFFEDSDESDPWNSVRVVRDKYTVPYEELNRMVLELQESSVEFSVFCYGLSRAD